MARTVLAGANIVRGVHENCESLEAENRELKENIEKLTSTIHEEFKDNCQYRAEIQIKNLSSKHTTAKIRKVAVQSLGVITVPVLGLGAGLILAGELMQPKIDEVKRELWAVENFPEAAKYEDIKKKAISMKESYDFKIMRLESDFEHSLPDLDSNQTISANDYEERKRNLKFSKKMALEKLEKQMLALKNEIQIKFYS